MNERASASFTAPGPAVGDRRGSRARISTAAADRFHRALGFIARLPAHALLGLVWLYQRTLSPALPVFLGPACGCRFTPTCSHYAAGALRAHGAIAGTLLALRRLARCTPLHPGGFDPVPPPRRRCRGVGLRPALEPAKKAG